MIIPLHNKHSYIINTVYGILKGSLAFPERKKKMVVAPPDLFDSNPHSFYCIRVLHRIGAIYILAFLMLFLIVQ